MTKNSIASGSIVILFVGGYFFAHSHFSDVSFEFLALTLVSLALSLSSVTLLTSDIRGRLAAWVFFAGFLGLYYFKFYLIVVWPGLMGFAPLAMASSPAVTSSDNLLRVYELMTLAFGSLCLALFMFHSTCANTPVAQKEPISRQAFQFSIITAVTLGISTSVLVYHYGMVMGTALTQTFPYHLRGVLNLSRDTLIPMLLLLSFQYAIERRRPLLIISTLFLILLFGLSYAFLQGSKGILGLTIVMAALVPVFLGRPVSMKAIAFIGVIIVLSVAAFYPFMGAFRNERGSGLNLSESIELAHSSGVMSEDPWTPVEFVLMRLTGADAFAVALNAGRRPLGLTFWRTTYRYKWGLGSYLTEEVFQVPSKLDELGLIAISPSLLGFLYVIDGATGIAAGTFLLTLVGLMIWEWIRNRSFISGPTMQAMFLRLLFATFMEGTLQALYLVRSDYTSFAASAILVELIARSGSRVKSNRNGLSARFGSEKSLSFDRTPWF